MIDPKQPGLWRQRLTHYEYTGKPGLFLDRDGVVVEEVNYLGKVENIVIIAPIVSAIAKANQAGIPVIMVTNQSGVGRGYFNWDDFSSVQNFIMQKLGESGAHFDLVLACAYHANAVIPYKITDHNWRKPRAGMFWEAKHMLGIDLSASLIVGDKITDIEAGIAAKLRSGALVTTGHGSEEIRKHASALDQLGAAGDFDCSIAENGGEAINNWLFSN